MCAVLNRSRPVQCVARQVQLSHVMLIDQGGAHESLAASGCCGCRRKRSTSDDGLRLIEYFLIKADGEEDLAVTAREIKSSGGHYSYHAVI